MIGTQVMIGLTHRESGALVLTLCHDDLWLFYNILSQLKTGACAGTCGELFALAHEPINF